MKKIPNEKAEQLESKLQECLDLVGAFEEKYGDECVMGSNIAGRINDILDGIGAFVINSLE